jgi:hypothetical protein
VLIGFISQMERYLAAIKVPLNSTDSLNIGTMNLKDGALLWYDHEVRTTNQLPNGQEKDKRTINNWLQLKAALLHRYQPIAQEQMSLDSLLDISYRGDVTVYNDAFLNHLSQMESYNNPECEKMIMGIYLKGITRATGTVYLATSLKSAIADGKATTLLELQARALLAQSNLGKTGSQNRIAAATVSGPGGPPRSFAFQNNWRNNNNARPAPSPGYSTPAKVNNINVEDEYEDNQQQQKLNHLDASTAALQYELEFEHGPSFHTEPNEEIADDPDSTSFLNAIKFYEKSKKYNFALSAEQVAERRKANSCFNCGLPGHFARDCRKPTSSPAAAAKPFSAQKK